MTLVVKVVENQFQLNCFGYLLRTPTTTPSSHTFGIFHCTQIHANNPSTFVIQAFKDRAPFNFIQLNPIFARILGVAAGDELVLNAVSQVPSCTSMEIYPETYEDWNVIETTAGVIEDLFLNQIQIVSIGMQFVLFVAQNVAVKFKVLSTTPSDAPNGAVIASNVTEVLVTPRVESTKGLTHGSSTLKSRLPRSFAEKINTPDGKISSVSMFTHPEEYSKALRVLSADLSNFEFQHLKFGNQSFVMSLNSERSSVVKKSLVFIRQIKLFLFLIELPQSSCNEYVQEAICLLKKYPDHCLPSPTVEKQILEYTTINLTFLTPSEVTIVSDLYISKESTQNLNIDCSDIDLKTVQAILKTKFHSDDVYLPVIVPKDGFLIDMVIDGSTKLFRVQSRNLPANCDIFWPDSLPSVHTVTPGEDALFPTLSIDAETPVLYKNFGTLNYLKLPFSNQSTFLATINNEITASSAAMLPYRALIIGPHGSGRSILLKLLANHCFVEKCVFSVCIDCHGWKSKSVETIQKQLSETLTYANHRKPSILFLDNVDFLNVNLDDEDRIKFVAKIYYYIAKALLSTPNVNIVATAKLVCNLPSALLKVDSKRVFDSVFEVGLLIKNDKIAVLKQLLGCNGWPLDLRLTSEETTILERLTLADLVKLAERTHLNLRAKTDENNPDFRESLSEAITTTPSAGKRVIKRSNVKEISFDNVGGLEDVKQKLREVFIWPSKYAVLFEKCGLRLGGGAILYGPSGCGKTLLSRAIGVESALNVVWVKGPELLSKYIGASEQNVRELFNKARQTKPSLIIFDEFDALAPKRGHDSTGVTDRVVNQLLTELDGIDSANEGLYVLAATNRIDLIDKALLRPGRFDHKILVKPPCESGRADTLRILCQEVEKIADDVDFKAIARQTDGYSGADLRGLVLTAQFEAAGETSNFNETPTITMKHLVNALSQQKSKNNRHLSCKMGHNTRAGSRVTLA